MKLLKALFFLTLLIIIPSNIYAAECSTIEFNKLKVKSISSTAEYTYVNNNLFNITFNNLDADFYIKELASEAIINYLGSTTKTLNNYIGGKAYTFYYYGEETSNCSHVLLRVQYITLPKYNPYSERDECEGIKEFELCSKWYPGTFTNSEFIERTTIYKEKKEQEINEPEVIVEEEPEVTEETLWDKVMDYLNQQYVLLLLGIIVAGLTGIVILKIRRRR